MRIALLLLLLLTPLLAAAAQTPVAVTPMLPAVDVDARGASPPLRHSSRYVGRNGPFIE